MSDFKQKFQTVKYVLTMGVLSAVVVPILWFVTSVAIWFFQLWSFTYDFQYSTLVNAFGGGLIGGILVAILILIREKLNAKSKVQETQGKGIKKGN